MNPNILNNFSPILALKTYYIYKCLDAKITKDSTFDKIPFLTITRELTTSKPGFTDDRVVSWKNVILQGDGYVVVRMVEPHTPVRYTVYKISATQATVSKNVVLQALGIENEENVSFHTTSIPYSTSTDYYVGIESVYSRNILNSTDWVDCQTPTKDNLLMVSLMRKLELTFLKINPMDDKVYNYIFTDPSLPRLKLVTYIVSNMLTGKEYIHKIFSDKLFTNIISKKKINDESDDDEF